MMKKINILVMLLICIIMSGCVRMSGAGWCFMDSDHSVVEYSAKTGFVAGSVIGIPASIISLPVTYPMSKHSRSGLELVVPWIFFGGCGAAITGYVPYELYGGEK
jgi:hypothetical protein